MSRAVLLAGLCGVAGCCVDPVGCTPADVGMHDAVLVAGIWLAAGFTCVLAIAAWAIHDSRAHDRRRGRL